LREDSVNDMPIEPVKDPQTVTPDGKPTAPRIHGLLVRPAISHCDTRGELEEVFRIDWDFHPEPVVHVYRVTVFAGSGRGWIVHKASDDRIYHCSGRLHWAFYDDRPDSPTYKMLNKITLTDSTRSLFVIPRGVYHACFNHFENDAVFINMPTRAYNHADPDKYRLPLKNDLIPYDFSENRVR
jgi:dTDP-4-dehydrorhamnose 3,5-epimerase